MGWQVKDRSWHALGFSAALFAGVMASHVWSVMTFDRTFPVRFESVETLNSPIASGDYLRVRIWRKKFRDDCPVTSLRQAVSENGVTFNLPAATWEGGRVSEPYLDYRYPTVRGMPPGNYELRVSLTYGCPGITFTAEQPPARFVVSP